MSLFRMWDMRLLLTPWSRPRLVTQFSAYDNEKVV